MGPNVSPSICPLSLWSVLWMILRIYCLIVMRCKPITQMIHSIFFCKLWQVVIPLSDPDDDSVMDFASAMQTMMHDDAWRKKDLPICYRTIPKPIDHWWDGGGDDSTQLWLWLWLFLPMMWIFSIYFHSRLKYCRQGYLWEVGNQLQNIRHERNGLGIREADTPKLRHFAPPHQLLDKCQYFYHHCHRPPTFWYQILLSFSLSLSLSLSLPLIKAFRF